MLVDYYAHKAFDNPNAEVHESDDEAFEEELAEMEVSDIPDDFEPV